MTMPMTGSSTLAGRSNALPSTPAVAPLQRYLCFGPFHMDLKREELFKDRNRLRIPAKVYQVLLALVERPGEVVTRDELRARLWPAGTFVNYDANVNTTVNKLRLALGDEAEAPQYVETIPRQGYCFVGRAEARDELAKAVTTASPAAVREDPAEMSAPVARAGKGASSFPRFLTSGWAAAVLLCGVLIGMGIVLIMHRPS
jgi:DNA-binding winged helix-turn-helix (wHTH) protein